MNIASSQTAILQNRAVFATTKSVLLPGVVLPTTLTSLVDCTRLEQLWAGDRHVVWWFTPTYSVRHQARAFSNVGLSVGCLAKLVHAKKRHRGAYDVLLQGIRRVKLIEKAPGTFAHDDWQVQLLPPLDKQAMVRARHDLKRFNQAVQRLTRGAADVDKPLVEILRSTADPVALCDIVAAVFIDNPMVQQQVLAEQDLSCRLQLLFGYMSTALARLEQLHTAKTPQAL